MNSNTCWTFSGAPSLCPGNIISLPQSPPWESTDWIIAVHTPYRQNSPVVKRHSKIKTTSAQVVADKQSIVFHFLCYVGVKADLSCITLQTSTRSTQQYDHRLPCVPSSSGVCGPNITATQGVCMCTSDGPQYQWQT